MEEQGRLKEALVWAQVNDMQACCRRRNPLSSRSALAPQAELSHEYGFNYPTKSRAGRVLGRVHAALGDHSLSTSAFDASLALAGTGRYLLQVRGEASHHIPMPFFPHSVGSCAATRSAWPFVGGRWRGGAHRRAQAGTGLSGRGGSGWRRWSGVWRRAAGRRSRRRCSRGHSPSPPPALPRVPLSAL